MTDDMHRLKIRHHSEVIGPWLCEECGQLSQFAEKTLHINRIFCRNPSCDFFRIVDKRHSKIVENDGTVWAFDGTGKKWRVRP